MLWPNNVADPAVEDRVDTDQYPLADLAWAENRRVLEQGPPGRVPWPAAGAAAVLVLIPMTLTIAFTRAGGVLEGLSVQLGVLATGLLVAVLLVVSRSRGIGRALGLNQMMRVHRIGGVAAAAIILVHVAAAVAHNPRGLGLLNPLTTTGAARSGIASTLAVLLLGATFGIAARRRPRYSRRHTMHVLLAVTAFVTLALHIALLRRLVNNPVVLGWLIALAAVVVLALALRWLVRPLGARGAYTLYGMRHESDGAFTLTLVPSTPYALIHFRPGQFVWLRLRQFPFAEEHPFTIASSADVPQRLELTIATVGRFTKTLRRLPTGCPVWLDGPYGAFTGVDTPGDGLVLIAGGAGLTPMISMLRTLADRCDTRRHVLLFSHSRGEQLFDDELERLERILDLHVETLQDSWLDPATLRRALEGCDVHRVTYWVCGPSRLISGALTALGRVGVDESMVNTESY